MAIFPIRTALSVVHILLGHVDFTAKNRRKARCLRFFIKFNRTIHDAVICHGNVRHAHLLGPGHQILDACRPIQQTVLRMYM